MVLATLAVCYTLWAAQDVILPILLSAFFALVGNPILRVLQRLYLPRFLAALLVLVLALGPALAGIDPPGPAVAAVSVVPGSRRRSAWGRKGRCCSPSPCRCPR